MFPPELLDFKLSLSKEVGSTRFQRTVNIIQSTTSTILSSTSYNHSLNQSSWPPETSGKWMASKDPDSRCA